MADLILRDADPDLIERVKRLADLRDCSVQKALVFLLDRGLRAAHPTAGAPAALDARVLAEAISALEQVPDDPGFALIGRAATPPAPRAAPDESVHAAMPVAGVALPTARFRGPGPGSLFDPVSDGR